MLKTRQLNEKKVNKADKKTKGKSDTLAASHLREVQNKSNDAATNKNVMVP